MPTLKCITPELKSEEGYSMAQKVEIEVQYEGKIEKVEAVIVKVKTIKTSNDGSNDTCWPD